MKIQRTKKNTILTGKYIYKDKHNQTLFFSKRENKVYRIDQSKENIFSTYQTRYVLSLVAFILFHYLFNLQIALSVGISIVLAIFLEIQYRRFLKKCPQSNGFIKTDKVKPVTQTLDLDKSNLILRIILYFALFVLIIINALTNKNVIGNPYLQAASYTIAIFALYFVYKYISLLIRTK